jgi:RecA-family ATPase
MSQNTNTEMQSGAGSADRTEEKPISAASILTQGAETAVSAVASGAANTNEANEPEYLLSEFGLTAFNLSQLKRQPKARWLIHGVLPWADVALIYGPSRIGKSFVVIDMVMSLTRGTPFAGIATDRVAVLYIVTEGFN